MSTPVPAVYGVFDATVDSVYDLVPEADRVTDANNSTLPTPITEDTVARWLVAVSDAVAAGIGDWRGFTGDNLEAVKAAGRAVVANGAASYLEAARYPTRAGLDDSTYAGVLWTRYTQGVTALAESVAASVATGDTGGGADSVQSGPFGAGFPDPFFVDGDPYAPWSEPCDPRAAW